MEDLSVEVNFLMSSILWWFPWENHKEFLLWRERFSQLLLCHHSIRNKNKNRTGRHSPWEIPILHSPTSEIFWDAFFSRLLAGMEVKHMHLDFRIAFNICCFWLCILESICMPSEGIFSSHLQMVLHPHTDRSHW